MAIVTLTTDWGKMDYYVGALKGQLLSMCPNVTIVDISHRITAYNIQQAAFVIRNSYRHFPDGTIHIVGVNSEPSVKHPFIGVEADGQYFLGVDNGILGLALRSSPTKVVKLHYDAIPGFSALYTFSLTAAHLAEGKPLEALGPLYPEFSQMVPFRAAVEESIINGAVIYIDSFQNAITNISVDLFERVGQNRSFDIYVQSNHNKLSKIANSYNNAEPGDLLAIFNSIGLLEIAIFNGFAAELLALDINSTVRVKFFNNVIK